MYSGGGHGGRGGRSYLGYSSGLAYDSIYKPSQMGSGGGAESNVASGRGGGMVVFLYAVFAIKVLIFTIYETRLNVQKIYL